MSKQNQTLAEHRIRIARESRKQRTSGDDQPVIEARRDYAVEKIADYIQRTVDAAPPLSVAQRDRLAMLLRGGRVA